MVIRHLLRHPLRALLSIVGVSLAVAVLILGSFMQDAVHAMFNSLFHLSKRHDIQLQFREDLHASVAFELKNIPGVYAVELSRTIPIRVRSGPRERLVAMQGVDRSAELSLVIDSQGRVAALPEAGLLISRKLAEVLEVNVADPITIEILEGKRRLYQLPVASLVDDLAGESVYFARDSLVSCCQNLRSSIAPS